MARPRQNKDGLMVVPLSSSREPLFVCEGSIAKPHRRVELTYTEAQRDCPRRDCTAVVVGKDCGDSAPA